MLACLLSPLDTLFFMSMIMSKPYLLALGDGDPNDTSAAMDQASTGNNSENGEGQQQISRQATGPIRQREMTISSDEVNYLIYR
jgi:hypothetical protein